MTAGISALAGSAPWRAGAVGAYIGALTFAVWRFGVPLEREQVIAWTVGGLIVVSLGHDDAGPLRAIRDWLVLAVLFAAYDLTRGAADWFGMPLQIQAPIVIDRALFPGDVPTVELQQALGPFRGDRWWEVGISLTYVSHFIVPFAVTALLWVQSRPVWRAWLARFSTLTVAGLFTYILVPTSPPWLASRNGHLPPLQRSAATGWGRLGLDIADRVIDKGQAAVNVTAAMPSLHAAYPALIAVFLWRRVAPRWRTLLAVYPLAMALTLVISAEHYVADILLGWVYVGLVVVLWRWLETKPPVARWLAS